MKDLIASHRERVTLERELEKGKLAMARALGPILELERRLPPNSSNNNSHGGVLTLRSDDGFNQEQQQLACTDDFLGDI